MSNCSSFIYLWICLTNTKYFRYTRTIFKCKAFFHRVPNHCSGENKTNFTLDVFAFSTWKLQNFQTVILRAKRFFIYLFFVFVYESWSSAFLCSVFSKNNSLSFNRWILARVAQSDHVICLSGQFSFKLTPKTSRFLCLKSKIVSDLTNCKAVGSIITTICARFLLKCWTHFSELYSPVFHIISERFYRKKR